MSLPLPTLFGHKDTTVIKTCGLFIFLVIIKNLIIVELLQILLYFRY